MKKLRFIIPVVLLILLAGTISAYLIYGSTLIDITSEESIVKHLSADENQPITILKTAEIGEHFGILYADPMDKDEGYFHFRSITKAKLYRNKYHNIGTSATCINAPDICYDFFNREEKSDKTAETFVYTFNSNLFKDNKCSVFECNTNETGIVFEEIENNEQIIEKRQKFADSYKKLDEFDLPNEQIYIIPKSYELSHPDNEIQFVNGSVSVEDMKNQVMYEADMIVKEYNEYKEEQNEKNR